MKKYRTSKKWWVIIHIVFPLLPFVLEGVIKMGVKGFDFTEVNLNTFSAATLAMTLSLLCLFVNQSLRNTVRPLEDCEETEEIHGTAVLFLIYAICGFTFFGVLVVVSELAVYLQLQKVRKAADAFKIATFVLSVIPVWYALAAQRNFKLRARI